MTGERPEAVQELIDRLSRLAKATREAAGMTLDAVAAQTHNDRSIIARLNSGAWVEQGMARRTLQATFEAMDASEIAIEEALALYDEITAWRTTRGDDQPPCSSQQLVMLGRSPSQPPGRPYASIDRVTLNVTQDERVEGTIERIEPESRRGNMWACSGYLTNSTLHLTFWPTHADPGERPQSDSIGQVAVQRQPTRALPWLGVYTKLERRESRRPKLHVFKYALSVPTDPELLHSASTVAVLDFDNTLAEGWILGPWLERLAKAGVGCAAEGATSLERLIAEYRSSSSFGHDRLAEEAANAYARSISGVSCRDVTRYAASFTADYVSARNGRLFPQSRNLLKGLRERGIRPILVSGAPKEVVDCLMLELDISTSFPLLLETRADAFTGNIDVNHGLAVGKDAACRLLLDRECTLAVAVGDSEGDRPMWNRANLAIRVGGEAHASDLDVSGLDLGQPLDAEFWARISPASWLSEIAG